MLTDFNQVLEARIAESAADLKTKDEEIDKLTAKIAQMEQEKV